jgi:type III pantothenate kinase
MKLLLDLGNTRLKAALLVPDGEFRLLGEGRHRDVAMSAALEEALADAADTPLQEAWCVNVAGAERGQALADAVHTVTGAALVFLRTRSHACGVRCAYAEPARLGADRWAALLGARGMTRGACLVADAGSALTIDAMAAEGEHLGGWILPGIAMMLEALETRTGDLSGLRHASRLAAPADFPADTAPAMERGAVLAGAGAITAALARLEARSAAPARLFLTGGDAVALLPELARAEHVPELVLRGLARAAAYPRSPA